MWDAETKTYAAKFGEAQAAFTFVATNVSNAEVSINSAQATCGCTVAKLPTTPYKLLPGSNVTLSVSMNLAGKMGVVTKAINVETTVGLKTLLVTVNVPAEAKSETK